MAYISSDGKVIEKRPFGIATILAFFLAIFNFFAYFFKSLFGMTPEPTTSTRGGHIPNKRTQNGGSGFFGSGSGGPSVSRKAYGSGSGVGSNVNSVSSFQTNTNFNSCPGGMCSGGPPL